MPEDAGPAGGGKDCLRRGNLVFPNGMPNLQLMVGPSIANNNFTKFKCTFEGTTETAAQTTNAADFPAKVLSFTRATPNAQESFTCGLSQGSTLNSNGDAKFYSYKMFWSIDAPSHERREGRGARSSALAGVVEVAADRRAVGHSGGG
jgi:hypothetical protein